MRSCVSCLLWMLFSSPPHVDLSHILVLSITFLLFQSKNSLVFNDEYFYDPLLWVFFWTVLLAEFMWILTESFLLLTYDLGSWRAFRTTSAPRGKEANSERRNCSSSVHTGQEMSQTENCSSHLILCFAFGPSKDSSQEHDDIYTKHL